MSGDLISGVTGVFCLITTPPAILDHRGLRFTGQQSVDGSGMTVDADGSLTSGSSFCGRFAGRGANGVSNGRRGRGQDRLRILADFVDHDPGVKFIAINILHQRRPEFTRHDDRLDKGSGINQALLFRGKGIENFRKISGDARLDVDAAVFTQSAGNRFGLIQTLARREPAGDGIRGKCHPDGQRPQQQNQY